MDAALVYNLPEILVNRPMTIEEIAEMKDLDSVKLEALFEVLSDAGIFQRDRSDPSRWRNNAQSVLLRSDHPSSLVAAVKYRAQMLHKSDALVESLKSSHKHTSIDFCADSRRMNALCAQEKDAVYAVSQDIDWRRFKRITMVGGCGILATTLQSSRRVLAITPNHAELTQSLFCDLSSGIKLNQSLLRQSIDCRANDLIVLQALHLLNVTDAEMLLRALHELCKHSGAQLMILEPVIVPEDSSTVALNPHRRRDALDLIIQGGILRSVACGSVWVAVLMI